MKKNSTAIERLINEGFFQSKEAALPYLMSGAVYCGAVQVTTGGQKVPLDKPMTVRGLDDRYVSKGGYKLEGEPTAFLIGKKVSLERKAEVLAAARELRAQGATVTVLPMAKNVGHQIELLENEGFAKFEKIFE